MIVYRLDLFSGIGKPGDFCNSVIALTAFSAGLITQMQLFSMPVFGRFFTKKCKGKDR